MKRTLFAFGVAAVVAVVSCKDETAPVKNAGEPAAPTVVEPAAPAVKEPAPVRTAQAKYLKKSPLTVLNGNVFNVGRIHDLLPVPVSFELRNDGDRPFPLDDIIVNCSCTVLDEIPEDSVIKPGETYVMNAKINPWAIGEGEFERGIELNTNFCPATELKIVGDIYPVIALSKEAKNLGWYTSMKGTVTKEFDIEGINDFAGVLELEPLADENFDVQMDKVEPGKYHVKLTSKGIMPPGIFKSNLRFKILSPDITTTGGNYVVRASGLFGTPLIFSELKFKLDRVKPAESGKYEIFVCIGEPGPEQEQYFSDRNLKQIKRRVAKSIDKLKGKGGKPIPDIMNLDEAMAAANKNDYVVEDGYDPAALAPFWAELAEDLTVVCSDEAQRDLVSVEKMPAQTGLLLKIMVDPAFVDAQYGMFRSMNLNVFCHGKKLETIRISSGKLSVEDAKAERDRGVAAEEASEPEAEN